MRYVRPWQKPFEIKLPGEHTEFHWNHYQRKSDGCGPVVLKWMLLRLKMSLA